jgi:hypothetical protein
MSKERTYWFEAKTYGIGWTLPATWQGWLTIVVFLGLLFAGLTLIQDFEIRLGFIAVLATLLVVVVAWKGERPFKWRWGRHR